MRRLLAGVVAVVFAAVGLIALPNAAAPPASAASDPTPSLAPKGYWSFGADGGVFTYGDTAFHGSTGGSRLNAPMVDAQPTPSGKGYWMLGADGGVFTYGDAAFFGSTGSIRLNRPVVGMAPTPDGQGYWFVASDGGVFSYGNAGFFGSAGSIKLKSPIVGMAATPSGRGYWLVASDGGIFAYGDAGFYGSAGAIKLNKPIVGMGTTEGGRGYWLVASDGGIFTYGSARFFGSTGAIRLNQPIVEMTPTPSNGGYWLLARDGGIFSYGDAKFFGSSASGRHAPAVAMATLPRQRTSETSIFYYPWYSNVAHDGSYRHWDQGGNTPPDYLGADYWPERGLYSSADATVVNAQMAEIKAAGIDTVVISWWGRGGWEDSTMPVMTAAANAAGLRLAVHIEPYEGRTGDTVKDDYAYLLGLGAKDFYIYEADRMSQAALAGANNSLPASVRTFAEARVFANIKNGKFQEWAKGARFTGVFSYAGFGFSNADFAAVCDYAHALQMLCSPSVAPGFSGVRATPIKAVAGRNNGANYDNQWNGAINAGADIVSITSYNEWHEGTQIEAAVPHCLPDNTCLKDYTGAWGVSGDARNAYMDRTKAWTRTYKNRIPAAF
jgi:hypothetical protein